MGPERRNGYAVAGGLSLVTTYLVTILFGDGVSGANYANFQTYKLLPIISNILQNDKNFKEAIGSFIIAFSELEFGLASLCSMTDFDLRLKDRNLVKYIGFSFDQKMKHLTEFIGENLSEIKPVWDKIKEEIGQLNRERRFLAHGFIRYYLPREKITTHIKEKGQIVTKNHTLQEIKDLTNRLYHVNTGANGINGQFHTLFTKTRVDKWNVVVKDEAKICFEVNNVIISEWKGKSKDTPQ